MAQAVAKASVWNKLRRLTIVRIVLGLLMVGIVVAILQIAFQAAARSSPGVRHFLDISYLVAWIGIVAVLLSYRLFVRLIEKRRVTELAASGAIRETVLGIVLGGAMFAGTIAILALVDVYHVNGLNPWPVLIGAIAGAGISAVFEEVLFRGIIFRITEESLGSWFAIAVSALLFGAVHLLNPHTSVQGGVAIVLEAGIFLAAAYMTTRRLWFVIGAHFGWNFAESGVFGAAVSGNASHGLINSTITGPAYLSGGIFGVEASIVAIVICLGVAICLLWRARLKGAYIAPYWRR
jgi:membrane protease YdiL (CAAX protease family)